MISFGILTHNETESLQKLLEQLTDIKHEDDEIVVLDDYSKGSTLQILNDFGIEYMQSALNNDFAAQKNRLNTMCNGEMIVNLDADELLSDYLSKNIHEIIEINKEVNMLWLPRINKVFGLTKQYIEKWGWRVNNKGHVNFPDYQGRIYRRIPQIYWKNPVHEVLTGYTSFAFMPAEEDYAILHYKTLEKQIKQNKKYEKIK